MKQKPITTTLTAKQVATIFFAGMETAQRYPDDDPFSFTREGKIKTALEYAVFDALNVDRFVDYIPLAQIRLELGK